MKRAIYQYQYEGLEATLDRIHSKKQKLDQMRPLPDIAVQSIKEAIGVEWTYNSNAIEGNTLTLNETRMVVEDGMTVKGKSLREHLEVVNHQDAIDFVEQLASPRYKFNAKDILDLHALVLQKIEKDFAGRYRNYGVRITGANFTPPNALKVDNMMDELIEWVNTNNEYHLLVKATIFHHRFVWIHPFFDGNGRVARLLLNLLLMKYGYPPAIILKADRKKYYEALNRANDGDYSRLLLLILQASERTLDIYLGSFTNTFDDFQPISNIVMEEQVPYGSEYVSLLARQGKINAFKEGNVWFTSKDAIDEYVSNRKRKRTVFKS